MIHDLMLKTCASVTPKHIQDAIKSKEYHLFRGTRHIVCCITLTCGYTVVGEAACADPSNFDLELGQSYALEDAERKVGALLAYEQAIKIASGATYDH